MGAQAQDYQTACNEFYERNDDASGPQRSNRQEGIGIRQEIFARMLKRPKLKDLIFAGHKEYETQNKPREQKRPTAIETVCFW